MDLESIQKRIRELLNHKSQLEAQYKQAEQQLYVIQGHINELQHQMSLIIKPSKPNKEEAKEEEQGLTEEEMVDLEMQCL